jgi:hypothetical protein
MALNASERTLLDVCAQAIVRDTSVAINLLQLRGRDFDDDVPNYLAEQVEKLSGGRYRLRKADPALTAQRVRGTYCYLARCPTGTPNEMVTELAADMFLVGIGPYERGCTLHEQAASEEQVAQYRQYVAKAAAERAKRESAEAIAAEYVEAVRRYLQGILDTHPALDGAERQKIAASLTRLSIETGMGDIARLCGELGVDLREAIAAN